MDKKTLLTGNRLLDDIKALTEDISKIENTDYGMRINLFGDLIWPYISGHEFNQFKNKKNQSVTGRTC